MGVVVGAVFGEMQMRWEWEWEWWWGQFFSTAGYQPAKWNAAANELAGIADSKTPQCRNTPIKASHLLLGESLSATYTERVFFLSHLKSFDISDIRPILQLSC